MEDNNTKSKQQEVVDFNLKNFFQFCLDRWLWFAICLVFSVGIALFYIYTKQPQYKRYEQILITDQDSGGSISDVAGAFSSLGLFSNNTNVYNELLTLTSPAVLYQVADSLQLDMNYSKRDGLRNKTLYGTNQPFRIDMLDLDPQESASFRIRQELDGGMIFYKFRKIEVNGVSKFKDEIDVAPGQEIVSTPIGRIKITPNPKYIPTVQEKPEVYNINKWAMQTTVELYGKKLSGDLADQDADVIELVIEDVSVQRAVDILNYVLLVYNQDWINDKNKIANATSQFIDERLKVIEAELGNVDQTIVEYIKNSGTPDVAASTAATLDLGTKLEQSLMDTNNELSIAYYMREFLNDNDNITTVLPANLGIASGDLTTQITVYNELLLNRNSILSNSSINNPLVQNYDRQLRQMRSAIEKSVDNRIKNLEKSVENIQEEISKKTAKMAAAPASNLPLLTEERQQTVMENLYLFLLQKREENELTQKFTADNIKIITPPVGPLLPVSPRKGLIIVVAAIIGLGVPFLILYYLETSNTTIRTKSDLSNILMPLSGEVPFIGKREKDLKKFANKALHRKIQPETKPPMVVVDNGNNPMNEAFRKIRSNLDFMAGKNSGSRAIMVTSLESQNGVSFITYNLALSYGLKGKNVLVIDCDLRNGALSMEVDVKGKGLSSYLENKITDWKSLIVTSKDNPRVSILPIGYVPSNPFELIEEDKIEVLIKEAKSVYDIILLDCSAINVVDTQYLAPLVDESIFVIRAGHIDKSMLKDLNEFYQEKKFNNISIILNGIENSKNRNNYYVNN